jgi:hypothetical protein
MRLLASRFTGSLPKLPNSMLVLRQVMLNPRFCPALDITRWLRHNLCRGTESSNLRVFRHKTRLAGRSLVEEPAVNFTSELTLYTHTDARKAIPHQSLVSLEYADEFAIFTQCFPLAIQASILQGWDAIFCKSNSAYAGRRYSERYSAHYLHGTVIGHALLSNKQADNGYRRLTGMLWRCCEN